MCASIDACLCLCVCLQVSLSPIEDYCASVSAPLNSDQREYEMALTLGLSLINAHKHLMS